MQQKWRKYRIDTQATNINNGAIFADLQALSTVKHPREIQENYIYSFLVGRKFVLNQICIT